MEAGPQDGPLVVLLHGFPEFWWGWRHQIAPLAERGLRVVVPDQRGYNRSDKPAGAAAYALDTLVADVSGLAHSYGRSSFRLVGHDWGGIVAWRTAILHPDRVERLVVSNAPHPDIWTRVARHHPGQLLKSYYVGLFQLPRVPEAVLQAGDFAVAKRMLTATSRANAFSSEDLERYAEAWRHPGALTGMLNYYRALRHKPGGRPARVRPPTLLVWGARDAFLQREVAQAGLKLCDRGEALFLEEATHWVHLEEADAVNAALGRFLAADP